MVCNRVQPCFLHNLSRFWPEGQEMSNHLSVHPSSITHHLILIWLTISAESPGERLDYTRGGRSPLSRWSQPLRLSIWDRLSNQITPNLSYKSVCFCPWKIPKNSNVRIHFKSVYFYAFFLNNTLNMYVKQTNKQKKSIVWKVFRLATAPRIKNISQPLCWLNKDWSSYLLILR